MIHPKKWEEVWQRYAKLQISPSQDLQESYSLGSGRGGQKLQKTESKVLVEHLPSGLTASSHKSRSKELNRLDAHRKLLEQLEAKILQKPTKAELQASKIRKQKKRRKRKQTIKESDKSKPESLPTKM